MTDMISPVLPQAAPATMQGLKGKRVDEIKAAAKGFEAMYVQEMLQHMWDGIETDGPMGGGKGEEIFRSMMIDQYGKMIADSGQTKIADSLTKEILRVQEQQHNPRGGVAASPLQSRLQQSGAHHE